ncbi:MAG TPA: hypothetical protein VK548_09795 [Candidatus Acidoferrum sp.]|nr:hypothetical protein [Candidatus Acidoferrum sp.]
MTAFYVSLLALIFYAFGNFGFLNAIGDRRSLQVVLLLPLGLLLPLLWRRHRSFLVEPLFVLAAVYFCANVVKEASVERIADAALALVLVAIVDSLGPAYSRRIVRGIVVVAAVFSSMVILQAVAVATNPGITAALDASYTSGTSADPVEVSHSLNYLGFLQPYPIFIAGHEFPRFESFASEPSVLIYSFLVPGILALGARGALSFWATLPIAVFVVILAASGTVWLSILASAALWPILRIFSRRTRLAAALPFIVTAAGIGIVLLADVPVIVFAIAEMSAQLGEVYTAFSKTGSALARLSWMAETAQASAGSLWGTRVEATDAGALLGAYVRGGVVGIAVAVVAYFRLFAYLARCVDAARGRQRIMAVLLFGTLTQVLAFSEYGWGSAPGFMMLALLTQTLSVWAQRAEARLGTSTLLAPTPSGSRA